MNSARPPVPLRIVVADDNVDAADTLAMLLETYGHTVRTAYDGAQAAAAAFADRPDVVVLDMDMPVMTGYEAAAEIARALPRTVVIAVSALRLNPALVLKHGAGFHAYVQKPIQSQHMLGLLQQLLTRRDQAGIPPVPGIAVAGTPQSHGR